MLFLACLCDGEKVGLPVGWFMIVKVRDVYLDVPADDRRVVINWFTFSSLSKFSSLLALHCVCVGL